MEVYHCKAQHEVLLNFIRYNFHFWGPCDQLPLSYWIDHSANRVNHPSRMKERIELTPDLKFLLTRSTVLSEECRTPSPPLISALRHADRSQAFTDILREIHWCISVVFHDKNVRYTRSALELNEFPWDTTKVAFTEQVLLKKAEVEDRRDLMLELQEWDRDHECSAEQCGNVHKDHRFCLATQFIEKWCEQGFSSDDSGDLPMMLWSFDDEAVNFGRLLGAGSFAAVIESTWLGNKYAQKVFSSSGWFSLPTEADALAKLNHPHIVKVYAYSENSLLLELMSSDLQKFIKARMRGGARDEPFSLPIAMHLMLQIADAVSYMHSQGMAHRDLKPSNILVDLLEDEDEDGYVFAKVSGFGLAKAKREVTRYSHLTHNVGTRRWMAPEVFGANQDDDHLEYAYPMKADVYSFGITCSQILTGEEPYSDVPPSLLYSKLTGPIPLRPRLPQSCPTALVSLICSCWVADPQKRPTFAHVCQVLRYLKGVQTMQYLGKFWRPRIEGISLMEVESSWVSYRGDQQPLPAPVDIKGVEGGPLDVELQKLRCVETPGNGSKDENQDEHRGRDKLKAELHVIDMVYADIPLDFKATGVEMIKGCLIASVQGVEAHVAEFLRLHSGKHIQVFNHECGSLVDTLSGTVHYRLRRYNNTLSVLQGAGENDWSRVFMSMAFSIAALTELERMFKTVVDLLTMCSKEDWWNTALELSNVLPSRTIPRWSSFSLAIRSCEWSMDIVDFGFHALQQFLAGASIVTGVVFKWSDKQSRMVLHIDGKPLYHDEGGSPLLDVTRDLEGKDVATLIQKLVYLNETPRRWFSWFPGISWWLGNETLRRWFSWFPGISSWLGNEDPNMHIIADVLSQKLHGPRPETNSVPYTFRVDPSKLEMKKVIACGGYGCVAESKWLGRTVSVKKVIMPGLNRKQFEMEAAILATVQHPRVVRMIGCAFEEKEGTGSLVMELMEGDLRHVIDKRCPNPARGVSPFPLIVAIDIMLQIGEGMQYLREHKILHRDLKAKNVLLNRCRTSECGTYRKFPDLASVLHTGEYYIVKLADFGISKASRDQTNFGTMMAGTTSWRAPEVYKDPDVETAQYYEWPADVYSFAMTCYEILTGRVPFDKVPPTKLHQHIRAGHRPPLDDVEMPPLLRDLVERCWETDPYKRPNFDEICKTLWQCKVEIILPGFRLEIGP